MLDENAWASSPRKHSTVESGIPFFTSSSATAEVSKAMKLNKQSV